MLLVKIVMGAVLVFIPPRPTHGDLHKPILIIVPENQNTAGHRPGGRAARPAITRYHARTYDAKNFDKIPE